MKRTTIALAAAALVLGLAACSSSNEPAEASPTIEIDTTDDLDAHITDAYNGGASLSEGDLQVTVESRGTELMDQDTTLDALQDIGNADLDYDKVTVTIQASNGGWCGHRYTADTVADIAEADTSYGEIVVSEIWDYAEASTPCKY
ncbi:hypothetical protein ACTXMZ_16565 [Brachybacterium alimentarium]|uniref:hypothetical protein n=1 Tax=Brachybacterium alimentarium TaxID=47845 RepID=UPI003FD181FB